MKIEIDLNDILGDENGSETIQESVRRQVIESVSETVKKGIGQRIDRAVGETISEQINLYLTGEMPHLLENIMDAEYTPVTRYGQPEQPTSFRKELLKSITENMVYKKQSYSSNESAFTRAVDQVIDEKVKSFKADFTKQVDSHFTAAAMQFAVDTLKKKLGITA
jgi:hypothetical protein